MYSCRDLVTVYTVRTAACAGAAEGPGERRRAINVSLQRLFIHFTVLCDLPVQLYQDLVLQEPTHPFLFHSQSFFPIQTLSGATGSSRLFLSAPRTATGDAVLGAVRGAEPEPPTEPLKPCDRTQNQRAATLVPDVFLGRKFLSNEPIGVGVAQVTSCVTRDCRISHMPGGTGA